MAGFGLILIGFFGLVFVKNNVLILIMNLELMLLGCGLNFLGLVIQSNSLFSYAFSFFILAFAGAESAVGLGLVVNLFNVNRTLDLGNMGALRK